MKENDKVWFSIKEAVEYLHMEETLLLRKVDRHNMGPRALPGKKGLFLSRENVMKIAWMIKPVDGKAE